MMRWLIKSRAAVDPPSDDPHNRFGGYFPLANACRRGNIECVKLLLEHRASTTRKTRLGKTATELAVISEHHDCAMLIVEHEQKLQEEHEVYQRAEEALNEAILHATRRARRSCRSLRPPWSSTPIRSVRGTTRSSRRGISSSRSASSTWLSGESRARSYCERRARMQRARARMTLPTSSRR